MKPRIAMVGALYPPQVETGAEALCHRAARTLADRGWTVRALASNGGLEDGDPPTTKVEGVYVDRFLGLTNLRAKFGSAERARVTEINERRTAAWLTEFRPDIVCFWNLDRMTVGPIRAADDAGYPYAFVLADASIATYLPLSWSRPLRAVYDQLLHRRATLMDIPVSPATILMERPGVELRRVLPPGFDPLLIHPGVRVSEFKPKRCPGEARQPFRLLCLDEGYSDLAKRVAGALGGQVSLRMPGRISGETLIQEYHDADALLLGHGFAALEAMACGTPVIGFDTGDLSEVLIHERNALVVPQGNADALVAAVERLIRDEELRELIALEGIRVAHSRFSLERYVDHFERWLLKDVLHA